MSYEIVYFPARGRAEILRLICEEGGVAYKNKQVTFQEWGALKASTPFGGLPVVEHETNKQVKIAQTTACARFLAKKGGLYPSDDLEAASVDAIGEAVNDLHTSFFAAFFAQQDKEAKLKEFGAVKLDFLLNKLEEILKNNGGEFHVGKSLTWADLTVFNLLDDYKSFGGYEAYPTLNAFFTKIQERPKLKDYLSSSRRLKNFNE